MLWLIFRKLLLKITCISAFFKKMYLVMASTHLLAEIIISHLRFLSLDASKAFLKKVG